MSRMSRLQSKLPEAGRVDIDEFRTDSAVEPTDDGLQ